MIHRRLRNQGLVSWTEFTPAPTFDDVVAEQQVPEALLESRSASN